MFFGGGIELQSNRVVHLSQLHKVNRGGAAVGRKKKKTVLYIGKEVYGKVPIEEAFKRALEPYFNKEKESSSERKTGS